MLFIKILNKRYFRFITVGRKFLITLIYYKLIENNVIYKIKDTL